MAKKQIIFLNRFFYPDESATAQLLSDLAFHLAEGGKETTVITTTGLYNDPGAALPERQCIRGVQVRRVYSPKFGRDGLFGRAIDYFLMHLVFAFAVIRFSARGDVIVTKTDPPMLSVPVALIALIKRARLVNWLQDIYPEVAIASTGPSGRLAARLFTPLRDLSLKTAHKNIVVGERSNAFLRELGIDRNKIDVIHNWCDDAVIDPSNHQLNPLRAEWGLEGKFIVAYSGNLGRAHEYQTILDAAQRLKNRDDVIFLFIGGGVRLPQLRLDIEARGLEAMFDFRPYQPHDALRVSLTLADALWLSLRPELERLIVPSKFYGCCAAGRPVIFIGDPESELAQLIRDNECGLSLQIGDDEKLADWIVESIEHRETADIMGANARKLLDSRFSRKHALESWDDALSSVLRAG